MRIIDIDIWTVVVPGLLGRVNSPKFCIPSWPDIPKQIIRLRADDGTYGLGETARGCLRQAVEALIDRNPLALPFQDLPLVPVAVRSHGPRAGSEAGHPNARSGP